MTCPICTPWCATTEQQFEVRRKNIGMMPGARVHPCPSCSGTDWATSREMIAKRSRFAWPWPFKKAPSWETIRMINAVVGGFCLAMAALPDNNHWLALVDAFIAGTMLAGVATCSGWIFFNRTYDQMTTAFDHMVAINKGLLEARVQGILTGVSDDTPPTAPKMH